MSETIHGSYGIDTLCPNKQIEIVGKSAISFFLVKNATSNELRDQIEGSGDSTAAGDVLF